jgi:hypothetical protein
MGSVTRIRDEVSPMDQALFDERLKVLVYSGPDVLVQLLSAGRPGQVIVYAWRTDQSPTAMEGEPPHFMTSGTVFQGSDALESWLKQGCPTAT